MKIHWCSLDFKHECGNEGTILEVCGSADGGLAIAGVCVMCARRFSIEMTMASIICECLVNDLKLNRMNPNTGDETFWQDVDCGKDN